MRTFTPRRDSVRDDESAFMESDICKTNFVEYNVANIFTSFPLSFYPGWISGVSVTR